MAVRNRADKINGTKTCVDKSRSNTTEQFTSKKRKHESTDNDSNKAPRRSGRGKPETKCEPDQLIKFLLSKEAENICRPADEMRDLESRGNLTTYSSSAMNPFQELLCAVILSRRISHMLGLRTIRTIFNDPYNFNSAQAIQDAGKERQRQAIYDARTQQKDKTTEELGHVADVVLHKFSDAKDKDGTQLQGVIEQCGDDVARQRQLVQSSIKGIGETGMDIFFRRVQWLWPSSYPFIDSRTQDSLDKLGLPREATTLQRLIEQHWEALETNAAAGQNEAEKKRRVFVTVLERAIGADLEHKMDELLQTASTFAG